MKTMELYFFRHGIALDRGDPAVTSDRDRPLTIEGIRKTRAAAEGLKRLQIDVDGILTSPWLRAAQTADILADVLQMPTEELPELAGDRTPDELLKALEGRRGRQILVGHEPLLGNTIGRLVSGAAPFHVELRKSGVCAVRLQKLPTEEAATLLWLLTSKQLRMIGKS